jgi:hypothetical protein
MIIECYCGRSEEPKEGCRLLRLRVVFVYVTRLWTQIWGTRTRDLLSPQFVCKHLPTGPDHTIGLSPLLSPTFHFSTKAYLSKVSNIMCNRIDDGRGNVFVSFPQNRVTKGDKAGPRPVTNAK